MRFETSKREVREVYQPSLLIEVGADGWLWDTSDLEAFAGDVRQAVDPGWAIGGPVSHRDGYCLLRFDPADYPEVPSPKVLVDTLASQPAADGVVARVPDPDPRLDALRLVKGNVMLRVFPREATMLGTTPAIWIEKALAHTTSRRGEPSWLAFGRHHSSKVSGREAAFHVLTEIASGWINCRAIWGLDEDVLIAVSTGGMGSLTVSVIGDTSVAGVSDWAAWLRDLGQALAQLHHTAYARIGVEPTGLGAFAPHSRTQPGPSASASPFVTERELDTCVPDAYWWQLVDPKLAERLDEGVPKKLTSSGLEELVFGDVTDWRPESSWLGDVDAPDVVAPPEIMERGRLAMSPLLWSA